MKFIYSKPKITRMICNGSVRVLTFWPKYTATLWIGAFVFVCMLSLADAKTGGTEKLHLGGSTFAQRYEELLIEASEARMSPQLKSELNKAKKTAAGKTLKKDILSPKPLDRRFAKEKVSKAKSRTFADLTNIAGSEKSFLEKSRNIRILRHGNLTAEQGDSLLHYIKSNQLRAYEEPDLNALSLRNDALECLLEQKPLNERLGRTMLSIVGNPEMDPIWREYVLQYFNRYYRTRWADAVSQLHVEERFAFQETLAEALFHEDSGLAGTALIVVEDLAKDYSEFRGGILTRAAVNIAESPICSLSSRLTALSVLGGAANDPECFQIVASLAEKSDEPLALRITATGQLARMAKSNTKAREKLQNIAWLTERHTKKGARLKEVAERHLRKFEKGFTMNDTRIFKNENKNRVK